MPYVFAQNESIPENCKRLMCELVDTIILQLGDESNNRDEAIHDARKAFKQLRAVLRLLRAELEEKFYQTQNQLYRDLSMQLAPLRDAYVLIESLDKALVGEKNPEVLAKAKILRKDLNKHYKAIRRSLLTEGGAVSQVITQLQSHRAEIDGWGFPPNKFRVIKNGLERSYQQGKKRLKAAYQMNSAEGFHEWRKAVKSLWYHCRLLEKSNPEKLLGYIPELKTLSEYLGDANDFAVLEDYLAQHELGQDFSAMVKAKQQELLAKAEALGKVLYQEDKRQFIKTIKLGWKEWQRVVA